MNKGIYVFVLTRIKTRVVFPDPPPPPTTNSRRRAFARNADFFFIVSGSERTFTFRVFLILITLLAKRISQNLERNEEKTGAYGALM